MSSDQVEVLVSLYEGIKNMNEIKELLFKDQLKMAVVNAELVYHLDQLLFAAYRSLYNAKHQQLKTKSVYTELLYNLFPSRSIRDSLKTFGAQDSATSAIFVIFSKESLAELESLIKARQVPLDKLHELRNVPSIRKLYKIPLHVTDDESILNCILTKISSKELLF